MTEAMNNKEENTEQSGEKHFSTSHKPDEPKKRLIIVFIIVILVVLTLVVTTSIFLLKPQNSAVTEQLRDVFIIFMALESLIIGIALVVLIVQLSILINLLQNEIRPIINSTNETVNTLKGTAQFVSNNLTEPVIKINQFMAMVRQLIKPHKR